MIAGMPEENPPQHLLDRGVPRDDTSRNLYQRLVAVKLALGGTIEKGGIAPQVMGGFSFIEWDDVAEKIGMLFADNGVCPLPSITDYKVEVIGKTSTEKDLYRATITLSLELINADNPEDRTTLTWVGVGDDTSDKSIQKAATSANKYCLIKALMLGGVKGVVDSDASAIEGVDSGTPGSTNSALCEQCQMAGFKSRRGYPPRYWPGRGGRGPQCDGVDAEGEYQNHRPKVEAQPEQAPRPGSAPRTELSEQERQDQEKVTVPPAAPVTAGMGGNDQGAGSPPVAETPLQRADTARQGVLDIVSAAETAPAPSPAVNGNLFETTLAALKALPTGWPAKMAQELVRQGMPQFGSGITPSELKRLPEDKLQYVLDYSIVLKKAAEQGRDPWAVVDPANVPF
jgi:hypothetical protein